jgi:Glyoxalase/Bleomycin resistance protein/Dioxygenase superfamily
MNAFGRRRLLMGLTAFAALSKAISQTSKPRIAARKLNQLTLIVTDLRRSLDFYQGLFGMPIQAQRESLVLLRIDLGRQ